MPPSISLCVMTPGPPERVRALLEACREQVDEIVLVADASGDPATLDACADLADARFSVDCSSVVVALGWILLQCRGDWVLRLDDDEVPGPRLLEELRAIAADRFPTNVAIRRHWLYPDRDRYLVTPPWRPDFQVRFVRNVPGIWSFPGVMHGALEVLGERRLAAEPLYHADLLLSDVDQRRAKRDRFAGQRPDLAADGFPVNDMYVPEDHPVETAAVPEPDRALVERVLDGSEPPPGPAAAGPPPRHVERAELERPTAARTVLTGAYRAAIRLAPGEPPFAPGEVRQLEVVAENHGDEWWPRGDVPPHIRLGSRWVTLDGEAPAGPEARAVFTEWVRPGQATRVMLRVVAPSRPGHYALEVDVVHEHVRWFGCAARIELDVVRP
jgi:hypothetical protein